MLLPPRESRSCCKISLQISPSPHHSHTPDQNPPPTLQMLQNLNPRLYHRPPPLQTRPPRPQIQRPRPLSHPLPSNPQAQSPSPRLRNGAQHSPQTGSRPPLRSRLLHRRGSTQQPRSTHAPHTRLAHRNQRHHGKGYE